MWTAHTVIEREEQKDADDRQDVCVGAMLIDKQGCQEIVVDEEYDEIGKKESPYMPSLSPVKIVSPHIPVHDVHANQGCNEEYGP
jgi:hypothetical protein